MHKEVKKCDRWSGEEIRETAMAQMLSNMDKHIIISAGRWKTIKKNQTGMLEMKNMISETKSSFLEL